MKRIYKVLCLAFFVFAAIGCDKEFNKMVSSDLYQTTPSNISNVSYESLPGQIQLTWDLPDDENYYFLRVNYYDHLTKADKSLLLSPTVNSLLIDGTRARYGDYEFTFQTFNMKDEGGEVKKVVARSGEAPITEVVSKVAVSLTGQVSTNAQEPTEGPVANLVDGNTSTYFHTPWSSSAIVGYPQYVDFKFNEAHSVFSFTTVNRNHSSNNTPDDADLMISNDGENWETIANITDLPLGEAVSYNSVIFEPGRTFTYLRFSANSARGKDWWTLAEFTIYDVSIYTFNPETDETD